MKVMKKPVHPILTRNEARSLLDLCLLFKQSLHSSQRSGRGKRLRAKLLKMSRLAP